MLSDLTTAAPMEPQTNLEKWPSNGPLLNSPQRAETRWKRVLWLGVCILCAAFVATNLFAWVCDTVSMQRTSPTPFIAKPSRPLVWGDVNFIHTTDTHGWLLGHQKASQPEPNASGTFGDLFSFVWHMKQRASEIGVDLLVVDSGDLHDGNGLSDGFPAGGVNGHETNKFFSQMPYDVLAIGNHELYKYSVSLDVHKNFAPNWKGRYLTSNVNIAVVSPDGTTKNVPIGDRFTKFKTAQGRHVTAFGVLFGFANNNKNTTVQRASALIQEPWFQEAIRDAPDFFLLVGHMAIVGSDWPVVFAEIRRVHPMVPVFVFGGHTHIRDCTMLDERSMALESGRYMETVGWMSATLPSNDSAPMAFSRRYLDNNRVTYKYHTDTTDDTFDTTLGSQITRGLHKLAKTFNLNAPFGVVPHDFYLDRVPYPSEFSVVSLFVDKVLPAVLPASNPDRAGVPSIILANSGAQRFDLFKGPFTRNDQFIVSPFVNTFRYLNVPFGIGKHVLQKLNEYGAFSTTASEDQHVQRVYAQWRKSQWEKFQHLRSDSSGLPLTLGYVTEDTCPGVGDDTPHAPVPYYDAPGYVSHSNVIDTAYNTTLIDLIFLDFFTPDIVRAVNDVSAELGPRDSPLHRNVTEADIGMYGDLLSNEVFGIYAKAIWS